MAAADAANAGSEPADTEADADASSLGMLPARRVADLFDISLRTLLNWEAADVLRPVRVQGRRYYRRDDVLRLLEQRERIQR